MTLCSWVRGPEDAGCVLWRVAGGAGFLVSFWEGARRGGDGDLILFLSYRALKEVSRVKRRRSRYFFLSLRAVMSVCLFVCLFVCSLHSIDDGLLNDEGFSYLFVSL